MFNSRIRNIKAADRLTTAELEALIKMRKANEPGVLDVTLKSLDEAQAYTRSAVSEGLSWLASAIRP